MKPLIDKEVILIVAHPDDEIIFFFPILKYVKKIICCSNDRNNLTHPKWKHRHEAFAEVGELLDIEVISLDYDSNFYELLPKELEEFIAKITFYIKDESMVCTHNSWGEYGHKDHILLNKIVKEIKKEILCSDIIIQGFVNYPQFIDDQDVQNENPRLWKRCKEIYLRYKCWTWSNPKNKRPILKAKFYIDK